MIYALSECHGDLGPSMLKTLSLLSDKAYHYVTVNRNVFDFKPDQTEEVMISLKRYSVDCAHRLHPKMKRV